MALFRVTTRIDAPAQRVWTVLADWEGSAAWMPGSTTVEVLTERREGAGTRVRAVTRMAGLPLIDVMTVVRWEPPRTIEVLHTGWPVRGIAWFALEPDGDGTSLEWAEELDPPLGPLGELGARILRGPVERGLRRSLARLRHTTEGLREEP